MVQIKTAAAWKKGDRVQFNDKERGLQHGTVKKGGAKVIQVVLDGGEYQVTGPATHFQSSTLAPPKDVPLPIDRWGVQRYKESGGNETTRFEADVTLLGSKALLAYNGGNGGCNSYEPYYGASRELYSQLEKDVLDSIRAVGGDQTFEVVDMWLEWKARYSFYETFTDHVRKDMEAMARYTKGKPV